LPGDIMAAMRDRAADNIIILFTNRLHAHTRGISFSRPHTDTQ
jgi:hypothetical protein